jgi:aromatic ring-cleaving dioxygenase
MSTIRGFHAHVYFDTDTRDIAERIYETLARDFGLELGRIHDDAVGPHTKPMFQVDIEPEQFATVVPWLMINRGGLSVFVHPRTDDHLADHETHPLWMGEPLAIDLEMIRSYVGGQR